MGGQRLRPVVGAVAQVLGHGGTVDDLARIHNAVGIERGLELPEHAVDLRAEHLLGPYAPNDAVAVFAAEGTAEILDQVADLVGDGVHLVDPCLVLEADHGADMQAADAGVSVVSGLGAVVANNLVEPADELAHVLRVYGGVLHEGQGLGVAVHTHQQAQAVLAHGPNVGLGGPVQQVDAGVTQAAALHVRFQALHLGG